MILQLVPLITTYQKYNTYFTRMKYEGKLLWKAKSQKGGEYHQIQAEWFIGKKGLIGSKEKGPGKGYVIGLLGMVRTLGLSPALYGNMKDEGIPERHLLAKMLPYLFRRSPLTRTPHSSRE
jgi:hypothetical protein